MSLIGNRAFMQRFVEFMNSASPKLAEELIAPQATFHTPISDEAFQGPQGYVAMLQNLRKSFSDAHWTLEDVVGEGNVIAARFTITGTHDGIFQNIEPTRKVVRLSAMNLYRLRGGKIIREFAQFDRLSLLWQLGVFPELS